MANYEATRYDFDGANLTGIEGIPSGTIVPWSDSSIPSGFLECTGASCIKINLRNFVWNYWNYLWCW